MKPRRASTFEEFLLHFTTLKNITNGDPQRISSFYRESESIRDAVKEMETFLRLTDFARVVFHGPHKHFVRVPVNFEREWNDYNQSWAEIVATTWNSMWADEPEKYFSGRELVGYKMLQEGTNLLNKGRDEIKEAERRLISEITRDIKLKPNERLVFSFLYNKIRYAIVDQPEYDDTQDDFTDLDTDFDPRRHDGADLIDLLISYLQESIDNNKVEPLIQTSIKLSIGAFNYLTDTIGLDIEDVFRRWEGVPITFMPAHITDRYGQSGRGSLSDLIDDAVRAYVFGAPAAAVAMCRAALEMVLKQRYGKGEWNDGLKLGQIIVLASQKFDFIQEGRLRRLTHNANSILHSYSSHTRMTDQDERTIVEFLRTVEFLIQRAPT
jgi:hypothetical protein